ncbi:MAG: hypothetical protein JRG80_14415, partial [Deltaproteobacteria bacterium]|nr:hypothetical protein [Deltaproteobacteria bacterium]
MEWLRSVVFAFFAIGIGLFGPAASAIAQPAASTITVEPAGRSNWAELLERSQKQVHVLPSQRVVPFMPSPAPRELGEPAKSLTPEAAAPAPEPGEIPEPGAPTVGGGFSALGDNNANIPPDTMGAAGPNHLMVMLNTQVRIQDKTGSNVSTVTLDDFWTNGTGLSGDPFDPRLIFDSIDDRWIATVDADSRLATSAVWFAISDTDDPTGNWTHYAFDADATNIDWTDFPGFGVNATWIAITNNMYSVAADVLGGVKMWVLDKSTALAGGALTITVFATGFDAAGGYNGFALQPAITFDPAESTLYIMDYGFLGAGGTPLLRMSQITGTGGSPNWTVVPGSPYAGSGLFFVANNFDPVQIDAAQAGTGVTVETNNPRLSTFTMNRNGHLWITHSGGSPVGSVDRTNVYWYELDPATMASSGAPIVQSGVIAGGAGTHHFFPSIAVNKDDAVFLGMSRSDSTKFVEAIAMGRESGDAAGTMSSPTVIKVGEDSYVKTFSGTRVRWGDYSATAIDPSNDTTFWTIQEYAETDVGGGPSDDRWGTWWARSAVCGNTITESGEECDDGNTNPGDCCSPTCQYEVAGSSCDDADVCNGAETCDGAGTCDVGTPLSCDDGAFCNGAESCDAGLGCQAGTPPVIDDGVVCTDDSC